MSGTASPSLRLVDSLPAAMHAGRASAVARANRAAAELPALTAQALFAASVSGSLEGGRAAALPADKRRRLVGSAVRLGIREFDAHLIIAMVQDRARREPEPAVVRPSERAVVNGLSLDARAGSGRIVWLLALSALLGAVILAALVLIVR